MRKIIVFTNISLDGYFEGPGNDLSSFNHDFEAFPADPEQQTGTLLFGRKTYEMMRFWKTPQAAEMAPAVARFMNDTPKFAVSRQPFDPEWQNVTVISGNVPGEVRRLKEQDGKDILILGSNELVVSLMQAGLVDELQIVVNPVALGQGTPLFKGLAGKTEFTLKSSRTFKSGAVMLTLEPARD